MESSESTSPAIVKGASLVKGWVGGWVDTHQKGSSIFLIFKYVNKQDVLFPKIVSKVVNDFSMSFKILFEVSGGGLPFSKLTYVRGLFKFW